MIPLTHQDFFITRRKRFAEKNHALLRDTEEREEFMEIMRCFRKKEEMELRQSFDHGEVSLEKLFIGLTALAEVCFDATFFFEEEWIQKRYGRPDSDFYPIAMGKFGGCEMTLQSDLDLIFLFTRSGQTAGPQTIMHQEYYVRLVQRIINSLSLITANGLVYRVDMKLRPSGGQGVLVSSWDSFEEYHRSQARLWEKQALLKARVITSDASLRAKLAEELGYRLWDRDYGSECAFEIHELRLRMERELAKEEEGDYNLKVGCGGLVDIEFVVQYLQLRYGREKPEVRSPHTLTALRQLASHEALPSERAELFEEAYLFYRAIETEMRGMKERATELFPSAGKAGERIAEVVGVADYASLRKKYETFRQKVRQHYLETLEIKP